MRRHKFDPISLVFGLLFAILGVRFSIGAVSFGAVDLSWLWPLAAVALGLALLLSARSSHGRAINDVQDGEGPSPTKDTSA
jgi:hypothetical protein